MRALYQTGRQADALAAYQAARQALVGELGLEPGAELRELHQQILVADPGLSPAARIAARPRGRMTAARSAPSPVTGAARREPGLGRPAVPRQLPAAGAPGRPPRGTAGPDRVTGRPGRRRTPPC